MDIFYGSKIEIWKRKKYQYMRFWLPLIIIYIEWNASQCITWYKGYKRMVILYCCTYLWFQWNKPSLLQYDEPLMNYWTAYFSFWSQFPIGR
jgi:hypothetical protein